MPRWSLTSFLPFLLRIVEYDSDEEDDEFEMGSQKHKDKSATATSVLRRNKSFEATLFAIQSMRDEYEFSFENMLAWEYDVEEFDPYVCEREGKAARFFCCFCWW